MLWLEPREDAEPSLPDESKFDPQTPKEPVYGQVLEPTRTTETTETSLPTWTNPDTKDISEHLTTDVSDIETATTEYSPTTSGTFTYSTVDPTATKSTPRSWGTQMWKPPTPAPSIAKIKRFIRRRDPQDDWEAHWRMATGWGSRVWGRMGELTGEIPVRARRKRHRYILPLDTIPA